MLFNVKKISEMLGINYVTLKVYLGHFMFNKYLIGKKFDVNYEFLNDLLKYSKNRRNYKFTDKIERFIDERINARKGICDFCTDTQNYDFTG